MSELLVDSRGKRYRRTRTGIEYERTIYTTSYGEVPESLLEELNKRDAERRAERVEREQPKMTTCPFSGGSCKTNCAIFTGGACALARINATAAADTAGKMCPFGPYQCRNDCTLYKGGCTITKLLELIK